MSKTAAWPVAPPKDERSVRRIAFSQTLSRWDVKISPYLYISPFFILFAITGMFPLAYTAWVSVHEWNLIGGQGDFVWFDNYAFVLSQPPFWIALRNTFSIFLISAVPQIAFALLIAAVLDRNLRAKTFWRMGVL
ncbi:MAG: ABC transporter permease, partial [Microbacterium sp.]|nr:ABC transporter permease [Microbacterium sp.]